MGVTLERVQNKFACIIGELCGEPKILSQFAIWLDLRLAEYKSKGSISLECSGCIPEPSWLEGLIPSLPVMSPNPPSRFPRPTSSYTGSHFPRSHLGNSTVNKSADVAVKDEPPGDDSFAYIRQCAGFDSGFQLSTHTPGDTRKRAYPVETESVAETCRIRLQGPSGHSEPIDSPVPVKRFRRTDLTSTPLTLSESDVDCPDVAILQSQGTDTPNAPLGEGCSQTLNGSQRPAVTSRLLEETVTEDVYNSREAVGSFPQAFRQSFDNQDLDWARKEAVGSCERLGSQWMSPLFKPGGCAMALDRSRSSCQTAKNIQSAATTFERWLAAKEKSSRRPMEEISPAELDKHLTDFFSTVKKRSGQDYNSDTLLSLRSYIDRYLREKGYPCSITKSDVFASSQMAFKARRQELAGGGGHLRSPISSSMLIGVHKQGGINLPLVTAYSSPSLSFSTISTDARNTLSGQISLPESDSPSEGNSISPISSARKDNSQGNCEDSSDLRPRSDSGTGEAFVASSHTKAPESGKSDQANTVIGTGVVQTSNSATAEKNSSCSQAESDSPSSERSGPVDVVHGQPFSVLSDSSRSSQSTEVPSSPLSFFSDLPRMPQSLPPGLQEHRH